MDWSNPLLLLWILPLAGVLFWSQRASLHPMPRERRLALLGVRLAAILLILLALAAPAWELDTEDETIIFVLDHSKSLGPEGMASAQARTNAILDALPSSTRVGIVSAGATTHVLRPVGTDHDPITLDADEVAVEVALLGRALEHLRQRLAGLEFHVACLDFYTVLEQA